MLDPSPIPDHLDDTAVLISIRIPDIHHVRSCGWHFHEVVIVRLRDSVQAREEVGWAGLGWALEVDT